MLSSTQFRLNSIQRQKFTATSKVFSENANDGSKRSSCSENLHQYLLNSSLHGLRYVGEISITYFERFVEKLNLFKLKLISFKNISVHSFSWHLYLLLVCQFISYQMFMKNGLQHQ